MTGELPTFTYHPDPIGTGSAVPSDDPCQRCGEVRGIVYSGPFYGRIEFEPICLWCIADGSAAQQWDAEFASVDDAAADVPAEVIDEILHRTPGFDAWQQDEWMFHCGDGAAYLGRIGWAELSGLPTAVAAILRDGWSEDALPMMHPDGDLTAYLFRCRHCGEYLANADAS